VIDQAGSEQSWPQDATHHPTLSAAGRQTLVRLRTHPHAPIFTDSSGSKLRNEDLNIVRTRTNEVLTAQHGAEAMPSWLPAMVNDTQRLVPFFRARRSSPIETMSDFVSLPTTSRSDLSTHAHVMVPDHVPTEELICFDTSGTTGHRIVIPSHPQVAALYLAHHRRAMQRVGLDFQSGQGDLAVALVGYQDRCFTYASVLPLLNEAGLVKLNLHPQAWTHPDDRRQYLESFQPEVISGDPVSLVELCALNIDLKPRAVFTTSMSMQPAVRSMIADHFSCPVFDFYSMNEAGPIGVFDETVDGFVALQSKLFIEILKSNGESAQHGERGEITVTGGFNFCLPLIRYRTGDYGELHVINGETVLRNVSGRPPVRFRHADGSWRNNNDLTHQLKDVALTQFNVHQHADGSVLLRYLGKIDDARVAASRLADYLGRSVEILSLPPQGTKVIQYTTDLSWP
jgi:phenylacetate-CoA ligase